MAAFTIPPEFQSELKPIEEVKDTRTDDDIVASLKQHVPVTSERNLWAYWHSGVDGMPKWCLRNVMSWVRICGDTWTVRVLDHVPGSPNNALEFAPKEMLPKTFLEKTMTGEYTGPHSADFIRGALLYTHGGFNMDVGCIMVRHPDNICWKLLEDPNSPYEIAVPVMWEAVIANHMIAARKGNIFIKKWHDLFVYLWKDRISYEGLSETPLLAFVRDIKFEESNGEGFNFDWKVSEKTVLEYITQVTCWQRLCLLEGVPSDPFNGIKYWETHVMPLDVSQESWAAENMLSFDNFGPRMFELMKLQVDGDQSSEEWQQAYNVVWRILTKSSVQKVSRGKGLTHSTMVGSLWDQYEGTDCQPGSFGELLRRGAERTLQTREQVVLKDVGPPRLVLKEGLFGAKE